MPDYKSSIKAHAAPSKGLSVEPGRTYEPKKWRFSLAYWGEIENFQVGHVKTSWFVSLLEQLKTLCCETLEHVLENTAYRQAIRYHPINWNAKNIPISKTDINWVGDALESPDVEICQFQISKGNGRVVGFFDNDNVFNILLLDPNHNIQPSDYSDYKVRPTAPSSSQLAEAIFEFREITKSLDIDIEHKRELFQRIHQGPCNLHHPSILVDLTETQLNLVFDYMANGTVKSPGEILTIGLDELVKIS